MTGAFSPLTFYNASIRHDGDPNGQFSESEVLMPDGTTRRFFKHKTLRETKYTLPTPCGPSLFYSFDDLMQNGLGFTKLYVDTPAIAVVE